MDTCGLYLLNYYYYSCNRTYFCLFHRRTVQTHFDFRRRCNSFFMDLVSLFSFGAEAGVIDSDLFSMFMSYVLEGRSKTKAFSPFPEHGIDATPVVRSFLLQQLLRNRYGRFCIYTYTYKHIYIKADLQKHLSYSKVPSCEDFSEWTILDSFFSLT